MHAKFAISAAALVATAVLGGAGPAAAGSQSSNSSSNSSNGIHTRVDTYIREDGRGVYRYERRVLRERDGRRGRAQPRYDRDDDDDD